MKYLIVLLACLAAVPAYATTPPSCDIACQVVCGDDKNCAPVCEPTCPELAKGGLSDSNKSASACHDSCQTLCNASCHQVCKWDCRIVNNEQVCEESCSTICPEVCNVTCHRVCN